MSLAKYRYIGYEDDGVSARQCLSCKATWSARRIPTNYCPSCGIKFEGELKWDEEKVQERKSHHDYSRVQRYWRIEGRGRTFYFDHLSEWGAWQEDYRFKGEFRDCPGIYEASTKSELLRVFRWLREHNIKKDGEDWGDDGYQEWQFRFVYVERRGYPDNSETILGEYIPKK